MSVWYEDPWMTVRHGDVLAELAELPDESVHCVVTSPPYWGLRDYGTASWEGGDEGCDHAPDKRGSRFATPVSSKQGSNTGSGTISSRDCPCGARRIDNQLGLEPTPEEYVANMVGVFREVRRVLRADGTLWLNLGDSYAGGGNGSRDPKKWPKQSRNNNGDRIEHAKRGGSVKYKDLVGIPWRVALALQADGWWLRRDIIWSKPNPMPESVRDRPITAHEYLFMLTKSPRYFYDDEAVREPATSGPSDVGRSRRSVWTIATEPYPGAHFATFPRKLVEPCILASTSDRGCCSACGAPAWRVVEREAINRRDNGSVDQFVDLNDGRAGESISQTLGWQLRCAHAGAEQRLVPALVLDPFAGSGTTLAVAQALSRRSIGIDISVEYLGQLVQRNARVPLGL